MKIYYFGHSYFYIKGDDYSIALDPFKNVGLSEIEVEADYVFCSHSHFDHNNISLVKGAKIVENGENFKILQSFHDNESGKLRGQNNVLLFNLDKTKIAFLGDYGEDENSLIENKLKGVDILLIPIGGKYTIDYNKAYDLVKKVEPKLTIPMHYKVENSVIDIDFPNNFLNKFKNYKIFNSPYKYNSEEGVVLLNISKGV